MALPSSTIAALTALSPLGLFPVTEKLTRSNHPMWKLQVLTGLRGAEMEKFINLAERPPEKFIAPKSDAKPDEQKPVEDASPILNPEFKKWVAQDQQVLSYLLGSFSREIGSQITSSPPRRRLGPRFSRNQGPASSARGWRSRPRPRVRPRSVTSSPR